jgi:hypothetical protein
MKLSGPQLKLLHQALMSAFPNRSTLDQFVQFYLGENLSTIAGGDTLSDLVFGLLRWAVAMGRVDELLRQAKEANPGNNDLHAAVEQIGLPTLPFDVHRSPEGHGPPLFTSTISPVDREQVDNQLKLLSTHRRRLAVLLQQLAFHGSGSVAPSVILEIAETRAGIANCKAVLRKWAQYVVDNPNDVDESP